MRSALSKRRFTGPRSRYRDVVSRLPKLTETFVLFEMLALEHQGVAVELYPLLRARETKIKVEGATLLA